MTEAFGAPGIAPRWTHGGKDGVGTAYSSSSRVWFTLWNGIVTETYFPSVDRPQVRDLQLLISDGKTFFHEEKRHLATSFERMAGHGLGYRAVNSDPDGRYTIRKEIIADPHVACVLQHTTITGQEGLDFYVLCAPHLEVAGWGNSGFVILVSGRTVLLAERKGTWLALGSTAPFLKASCGYTGASDGWTDLASNFQMDWQFDSAPNGNIALTGQLDLSQTREFTLALAFGVSRHSAITRLLQSLATPFETHLQRFTEQWDRSGQHLLPLSSRSGDSGQLYRSSLDLLRAHEDKSFPGAFIASLSIPWGEAVGDEDQGGYHLVWTRDMISSATAMLAAGDTATPLRALIYLSVCQQDDGGFAQNFWIDGVPYWTGVQLDETAFPIHLAWRLYRAKALQDFDPYPLVMRAAGYLVRHGPLTPQDRWEEVSGYSPSTLAATITALVCAAAFARGRGEEGTARYLEEYADFLECHVERWTVTTAGTLLPGVPRHYIRVHPVNPEDEAPDEDPNHGTIRLANRPPGQPSEFPAKEIVDAGFLELVRYGIRGASDAVIVDSLKVVDAVLKSETPHGVSWHRYNHDGYGQRPDGGPYEGWGMGGVWPLLTGERGHYEVAAGHDPTPYIRDMETLASKTGLLPEQCWDAPDLPEAFLWRGRPTGSAMPLMWAHAEYVKLLRSAQDGKVFDCIPEVAARYLGDRSAVRPLEIWKPMRRISEVRYGYTFRIQRPSAFRLRWSVDEWKTVNDTDSTSTRLGVEFVDIAVPFSLAGPIRFTFFYPATSNWEGRDYAVSPVAEK